jgi:N-methylhydantoinase A
MTVSANSAARQGGGASHGRKSIRVAVDIGGTFTDFVVLEAESGNFTVGKVLSDPEHLTEGVLRGLERLGIDLAAVEFFVHGTTVALNAIVEEKGVPVALVTTQGFRDILEIGRMNKPDMYNIFYTRPRPLVPRRHRYELEERIDGSGRVLRKVEPAQVKELAAAIRRAGITSVAISTLNSFVNPEHELAIGRLLAEDLDDAYLSISHEIVNEWREFERTSTTVLNAYVLPIVRDYLRTIGRELCRRGLARNVHIMQSNGGVMTASAAETRPVYTLLSGPVGGAVGIKAVSESGWIGDRPNIIAADVGGTSFDASLIIGGEIEVTSEGSVAGYPVVAPAVRVSAIGAGGGSIARVEGSRSLRVGPESAGARPGPVCYRAGGSEPTVTDANLVLGRLDPDGVLAGDVRLDLDAARAAIQERIAEPLGLGVEEASEGVLSVINSKMALAIRELTVAQGLDPRDFIFVAFGGAGPMHAAAICSEIGIPRAVIPRVPGMFSAWGMLTADLRRDAVRTIMGRAAELSSDSLEHTFSALELEAQHSLEAQGVASDEISFIRSLEMRYVGQEYTLTVPVTRDVAPERLKSMFDQVHERRYGHLSEEDAVETVHFRVMATGTVQKPALEELGRTDTLAATTVRPAYFDGRFHDTPVHARLGLSPGARLRGPAIVEEEGATTILPPGAMLEVDVHGNLALADLKGRAEAGA